jgi:hypothetical protein
MNARSRTTLRVAEQFADNQASAEDVLETQSPPSSDGWGGTLLYLCRPQTDDVRWVWSSVANALFRAGSKWHAELDAIAALIRDIFGNPFRPVALDPAWLTTDVLALARGIYADRVFDRMGIFADALQDAGCENEDVLFHCRAANQVHARGCWVLDLVLGKK